MAGVPSHLKSSHNLVPRAFSSFKMAVGETTGQRLPYLFSAIGNRYSNKTKTFSCLRDEILTTFWSHFGSLGQLPGVSPTAILNKEEALGTRLVKSRHLAIKQKRHINYFLGERSEDAACL